MSETVNHINLHVGIDCMWESIVYVRIDHARDSVYTEDISGVTAMPQGTRMHSQAQVIIKSICNHLHG